jgi:hypothetical protein
VNQRAADDAWQKLISLLELLSPASPAGPTLVIPIPTANPGVGVTVRELADRLSTWAFRVAGGPAGLRVLVSGTGPFPAASPKPTRVGRWKIRVPAF